MIDARQAAVNFEAVKLALRQSKDGISFTLAIHPNDMRGELWQHPIGARYMVALVRLGDDDQPVSHAVVARSPGAADAERLARQAREKAGHPKQQWRDMKLVTRAAILCADEMFWTWAMEQQHGDDVVQNGTHAAEWLRERCGVTSRRHLDSDPDAAQRYVAIERKFFAHKEEQARYGHERDNRNPRTSGAAPGQGEGPLGKD